MRYITAAVLLASFVVSLDARADVVCQNSRTKTVRTFFARICPRNYNLIIDTALLKGDKGDKGDTGATGRSVGDTLASGITVKGYIEAWTAAASDEPSTTVSTTFALPGIPPVQLTNGDVSVMGAFGITCPGCTYLGQSDTTACPGNIGDPVALPGKLCIYIGTAINVQNLFVDLNLFNASTLKIPQPVSLVWHAIPGGKYPYFVDPNPNATLINAVWVYTAP